MEPTLNPEVADTARSHDGPIETDAVIVGAGPVGLFQVFELGLLEIKAHIIDSLAYAGGQCIELYPDKPIYDIPAVPVCTGKELTDNLLKQIEPFGATFHLGQEVNGLAKQDDGRFLVTTSKGTTLLTKTVFIAGGVGSFQPRTLKLDGLDKFLDTQLHLPRAQPGAVCRQEPGHHRRRRLGARLGAELRAGRPAPGRQRDPGAPPRRLPRRAGLGGQDARAVRGAGDAVPGRPGHRLRRKQRPPHGHQGHRRRCRDTAGAAGHAAGVLRPEPEARAPSPTGAWASSASRSSSTPRSSKATSPACLRWATSTPTRARRS